MRICLISKRLPSLHSSCYRVFGNKSYYYQIIGGVWGLNRFWSVRFKVQWNYWTGPLVQFKVHQIPRWTWPNQTETSLIWRAISWLFCDNWNATVLKKNFADLWSSLLLEKKKLAPSNLLLFASCATVLMIIDFPILAKPSSMYIWDWLLCKLLHHEWISFKTSDYVPSKQVGCAWLV